MMPEQQQIIDILFNALAGALSDVHTVTIAKVTSVGEKTIEAKPVINRVVNGESIELPVFADVPPIFIGGGSSYVAMPISVDDYCLLIFTERCFDRWWNGQDFQDPAELRMHDYSDGFALVGIKNMLGAVSIPSEIVINGDMCLGSPGAGDFLALASKVDAEIDRLWNVLTTWTVVPMDGGAALQAAANVQAPSVQPVGSSKIKAE